MMRKTPIRRVNPARLKKLREVQYGAHAERIREMPCLIQTYGGFGCEGQVVAHHAVSRGAGGLAKDLTPLCNAHHLEVHQHGAKTFMCRHLLDLKAEADRLWEERCNEL